MVKREIVPTVANALTEQESIFVHLLSQGAPSVTAAMGAGYAAPKDAARRLLRRPAIQAELAQLARAADTELETQSRFVLRTLLDSSFTPATVKARISLELLKRADKREESKPKKGLADMSEADLMRLITEAQSRLGIARPDVIT